MPTKHTQKNGLKALLTIASGIVIIAGLQAGKGMLLPIVLACFFAIVSYPVTNFLKKFLKFPHWLAVFFTVVVDFAVLGVLGFIGYILAADLSKTITDKYVPLAQHKVEELKGFLVQNNWENISSQLTTDIFSYLDAPKIVSFSTNIMAQAATFIATTTLILILMTFFLSEGPKFNKNANRIADEQGEGILKFIKALSNIQQYLIIKTLVSGLTGLLAYILCKSVGVDFPLLWGIIAFAFNFIPTFGSIIAAIPPALIALLLIGPTACLIVVLGYLAINMVLGNCIEPKLLGKQFGIATSVVLLSVIFWGWVWGPIGMLMAVPITLLIKLGLECSTDLKWAAMLIDSPNEPKFDIPKVPSIVDLNKNKKQ